MQKIFGIIFVIFSIVSFPLIGRTAEDTQEFIKNNPDGQKYDFVRNYLSALNYIYMNETRKSKKELSSFSGTADQKIDQYARELTRDNVNIRTARNLLKRYFKTNNPLMVKATDLFYQVCDEQTKFNDQEITLLKQGVSVKVTPDNMPDDKTKTPQELLDKQSALNNRRKDSMQKLLEASMLVSKVLISSKTDQEGELVALGVNEAERKKLLVKVDSFYGSGFEGQMREGQSFLQASIAAIREVLEDYSWGTLDDLAKKQ
jgi:hypothetical protein